MGKRKFAVISGFLGAGKTTGMIALVNALAEQGTKAAIICNDLGASNLVDALYTAEAGCCSGAIAGGCICYQTETLVDRIKRFTDVEGAQLVMSDIPGCGVGALDHVYLKLAREYPEAFELAPFTVVCDPLRLRAIMPERARLHLPEEMNYLFRTQLLEADVIVLNKIDTISEAEKERCVAFLNHAYPGVPVFPISAKSFIGVRELAVYLMTHTARLIAVDTGYGGPEFLAAESKLSWYDRRVFVKKAECFDGNAFFSAFMEAVREKLQSRERNVPHLKVFAAGAGSDFAKASLIGVDCGTAFDRMLEGQYEKYSVVVNARAACESQLLDTIMDAALEETAGRFGTSLHVFSTECFGMTDEGR